MQEDRIAGLVDFFSMMRKVKDNKRFTFSGEPALVESVADHSWRTAFMVSMFADEMKLDIDRQHAVKLAITHDICEWLHGDVDRRDVKNGNITKQDKESREAEAMQRVRDVLPEPYSEEVYTLWEEYDKESSEEARFVKAIDRIETMMHVTESGHEVITTPEITSVYAERAVTQFPKLIPLLAEVKKRLKEECEAGNIGWKPEFDGVEKLHEDS